MPRKIEALRVVPVGESAVLLSLAEEISPEVNERIRSIDHALTVQPLEGILESVPGYASLLVFYDPERSNFSRIKTGLISCLERSEGHSAPPPLQITIPVVYGGANGPDLPWLSEFLGLSPSEVVRKHAAATYRVGMMGFTPGFAYLMGLDPDLAAPRRETPRTQVPAGSVGIAGSQTGVYPMVSPGGWQLIGRTDLALYDHNSEQPFLLSPGDEVTFSPQPEGVMP